jgi:hypothetical protein
MRRVHHRRKLWELRPYLLGRHAGLRQFGEHLFVRLGLSAGHPHVVHRLDVCRRHQRREQLQDVRKRVHDRRRQRAGRLRQQRVHDRVQHRLYALQRRLRSAQHGVKLWGLREHLHGRHAHLFHDRRGGRRDGDVHFRVRHGPDALRRHLREHDERHVRLQHVR